MDVFTYGSRGDTFYIILAGTVGVFMPTKVKNEETGEDERIFNEVAELGRGDAFGELALLRE